MKYKFIYLFYILLLSIYTTNAHNTNTFYEPWRIISFGQNEGIPEGKTYGMFIQKNGTTWLGTQNGLAKFDGYKWYNINFINTPHHHNDNLTIREKNNDQLICLHFDTLYEVKNNKYRKIIYTINNKVQQIIDYALLSDGTEYFLTHEGSSFNNIKLIQKKGKQFKILKELSHVMNPNCVQLFQNRDNSMVINDGQQLYKISPYGQIKPITTKFSFIIKLINTQTDEKGNLYFYINSDYSINGIYTYSNVGKLTKENPFSSTLCKSFDVDKNGNIIALSDVGKTFIKTNGEWAESGLFENHYNKNFIQFCQGGNIWVGCKSKLICYNTNETKCKSIKVGNSYETNTVYDIFTDNQQNIWLAKYRGITVINKNGIQKEITEIAGNSIKNITTINQDRDGNIWIGSGAIENSTYKFDGKKFERIGAKEGLSNKSVHKIWKDLEGNLWFSVFDNNMIAGYPSNGLYKLENGKFIKPIAINTVVKNTRVYSMLFDTDGSIYIGGHDGIIKTKDSKITKWTKINDDEIGKVSDIVKDKFGQIWFSSTNTGICNITNDLPVSISKKNNVDFPLNYCDLEFDSTNTLWYSGIEYLTAYQNGQYYKISTTEGLAGQASWPIKSYNNKIYVGTYGGGLSIFDFSRINKAEPIIEVIDKQCIDKNIFIHWIALSKNILFNNNKISCVWRIDNGEWHTNTSGDISIHELNYGNHILDFKTHSELPNINDNKITSFEIEIPYPYYLSKAFVAPIFLLIILLLIGVYLFLVNQGRSVKLLNQKQEQLKYLGGSLPIIPFIIDENGTILESFVNKNNTHNDINLTDNEKLVDQLPEQFRLQISKAINHCFTNHSHEVVELNYSKFGKDITYEIRLSPYSLDSKHELKRATCVAINISQNKKNELELIKARLVAESSEKAKMLFLTNMSHEIRTPMNAIVGITDILIGEITDLKFKDNLNIIKHSADNLLVIINDILDFSKIEAGKIEFEKIEFDVIEMLDNLVKTFKLKTDQKKIFFEINIDENLPHQLIGDPYRLNQVLVNVINNAIKFTEYGGITFKVDVINIEGNIIDIRFNVSDTGIGISPTKIESIFESFTQESNVITRKFGGTGLGLTISKRLVEMQNGKIKVESQMKVGSKFIV
ncbi:MAG: ATP-binding protein, partial [Bacteroidetes bacterium]|nr:ATP-binding protein [Bacteroidota bacterium]